MIALDTNLLIYAHRQDSPHHQPARACLKRCAEGTATWALPWPCLHEFYAIVTHPRVYAPPTPMQLALEQIEAWLESPTVVLLTEGQAHWKHLRSLIEKAMLHGPAVHDARIAALCIQHGVSEIWTADRDFARFAGIKALNPLVRQDPP